MCVSFKAVALSMSTAAHSLLPSSKLDVPPCSSDTGLWSFKAITMALKQALNSINLFKTHKNINPSNFSPLPPTRHTPTPGSSDYTPPGPRFLSRL